MATAIIAKRWIQGLIDNYVFAGGGNYVCHLYTNDLTPTRDTQLTDFVEAAYPNYVAVSNSYPPTTPDGNQYHWTVRANSFSPPSSGGSVTVYGFYVTGPLVSVGQDQLMMSARFAGAPVVLSVGGAGITLNLDLHGLDENNP